jgi:hypothetical protein
MTKRFSERHGVQPPDAEITVREDAPEAFRYGLAQIARAAGMSPSGIREIICGALYVAPDRGNWSEYPNIWGEVQSLLEDCLWYKVYDIAEIIYRQLDFQQAEQFKADINRLFKEKGIGWQLTQEGIVYRGGETFAAAISEAAVVLHETGRGNAANEIREAIKDISRRPTPDVTGAIQHSMAALECTARDVLGSPNETLGQLLPRLAIPKPLDTALDKLWGFASDRARHIREGDRLDDTQAELVVSVACAVCAFLVKRIGQ